MKGTIDVQIKHKDGSIETRHEHNVVFDLQAIATKLYYGREYGPLTGSCPWEYISSTTYDTFSLSTLEIDTSKPSFPIPALNSISSGSSSVWYTAPITSTISDKYRISSATWTAGEAITLKSIFFPYDGVYFAGDTIGATSASFANRYRRCILSDDGLFVSGSWATRLISPSARFKLTNKYLNGFTNESYVGENGTTTTERAFAPYKLHDPTERFLFDTVSGENNREWYYPYYSAGELQIKDAATNTVKRSFNLSQFADFLTGNLRLMVRVINTGSKNLLLQPVSVAEGIRVWQIPDAATEETIQPLGMILADKDVYIYNSTSVAYAALSVVDNVLIYCKKTESDRVVCAKINDDLSVDIVPGANANGIYVSKSSLSDSNYNSVVCPYLNTDSPWLYRVTGGDRYQFENNATYYAHFFNSTAANFSTPIVLAEGDVLTVSYKIEVA